MHLRHQLLRFDCQNHYNGATPPAAGDNVGFLLLSTKKSSPLFYLEYDENGRSYKKVKRINHPHVKNRPFWIAMVGSCNGLVCFAIHCLYGISDPVYICNPITNECIKLPKINILRDYKGVDINKKSSYEPGRMVSGFGCNPSTNEYKVVRIIYYDTINKPFVGRVQVYTLGDGNGWRKKGEITYKLIPCSSLLTVPRSILANGALHWINYEDWNVVSFDMEKEEFNLLPLPPNLQPGEYDCFQLRELGGCLCVIQLLDSDLYQRLHIWSFKKRSCEWEMMFSIPFDINQKAWHISWPITLTMGGEVLLLFPYDESAFRYDPKTATLEKLVGIEDFGLVFPFNEAIPHMSSFVSLRALGENSRRIR